MTKEKKLERHLIVTSVEHAEGTQTWWVDATSSDEALAKFEAGDGEIYSNEVEVTKLGEPAHAGIVDLDDFGDVEPTAAKAVSVEPEGWNPATKPMTADRAAYFMRRFKKEEKLLGPNEQAALDYGIALLEQPQAQGATVNLTDAQIDKAALVETGFEGDGTQAMNSCDIRRIVRAALAANPQASELAPSTAPAYEFKKPDDTEGGAL